MTSPPDDDTLIEQYQACHGLSRRSLLKTGAVTAGTLAFGVSTVSGAATSALQEVSRSDIMPIHNFVRKADEPDQPFDPPPLAPPPEDEDRLVERCSGNPVDDGTDPSSVDGDLGQLTWEQFSAVEGDIDVVCVEDGTDVSLQLQNLVPNGVYTVWSVVFEADDEERGFIDDRNLEVALQNLAGFGPLGPPDGSENVFEADDNGEGELSTTQPGGDLGAEGSIEGCALGEFEWHVVVGLHLDGETYGSYFDNPDDPGVAVEQAGFVFTNGRKTNTE